MWSVYTYTGQIVPQEEAFGCLEVYRVYKLSASHVILELFLNISLAMFCEFANSLGERKKSSIVCKNIKSTIC